MADTIRVVIRGPDLVGAVKLANARIEVNTERSLDRVAKSTQTTAKIYCPVSRDTQAHIKGTKTHMRDDIKVYGSGLMRQIGTNKHYGIFVHDGTTRMRARPFLKRAFDENHQGLLDDLKAMKV